MPSELTVPVVKVLDVNEHPNADRLEIASVLGWKCVIGKRSLSRGDLVFYFPIDSIIQDDVAIKLGVKEYLGGRDNNVVKAVNLRGVKSFGLAVPVDADLFPNAKEGDNFAEYFKIKRYQSRDRIKKSPDAEKQNPLFYKYCSINHLNNHPDAIGSEDVVFVTEKIHGSNFKIGIINGEIVAGSNRVQRKKPKNQGDGIRNPFWHAYYGDEKFSRMILKLQEKGEYSQVLIYGEVYGPEIQRMPYGLTKGCINYLLFDVMVDGIYLPYHEMVKFFESFGIGKDKLVHLIYEGKFDSDKIKNMANGESYVDGCTHYREGIVIKCKNEYDKERYKDRRIFKVIGDSYALNVPI